MVAKDVSGKKRVPATAGAKAATRKASGRRTDAEGTTAEKGATKAAEVGPRSGAGAGDEGTQGAGTVRVTKKKAAGASASKRASGGGTGAEKAPTRETAARKTAARKTAARKAAAGKAGEKEAGAKESRAKETGGKETTAKKAAVRKTAARKTAAKDSATARTVAGKSAATTTVAGRGAAPRTAPAKSSTSKKSTARNTPATSGAEKAGAAEAAETTGATTVVAKNTPGTATAAKQPGAVPKARPAAADPGELAVRPGEEPWSPEEVAEARTELQSEAMRLRAELDASEKSLTGLMRDSGDGAGDDQADTGAKNITREHEMALAHNAREMLDQTERALERLATGTYGLCESCGNPIGKARMQAFPRATLCVECKQKQERR
ncbi:TraR/DksA C4-type zinc finger protein [Streptomyces sp. HM190]|uniref:TraR/DksA C4-type zinc finger protein n=1 Tax=Streptomyces sp. HM190 TaxID=2695266 RepID=UPI0013597E12|nr:TraR/DksA C4-type zinc finger protein [Streptomyces sp. HM190]